MNIKGLYFVLLCGSCPEQYDIYDQNTNCVGYVRLRHGLLTCRYPNASGDVVYKHRFVDEWMGNFDTKEQRIQYLNIIADVILEQIQNTAKNHPQHHESENEDYFECKTDYEDGTMGI